MSSFLGQSSFFVRADEDEIENDDDVIAETEEADVDDDGTDLESTGEEGDEGPSTSQDVDTTILFTKPKLTNDMGKNICHFFLIYLWIFN